MRTSAGSLTLLAALALLPLACDKPGLDEYEPRSGVIRGTVLYPGGTARGNVIILLFAANNPPPPLGSGRPVNFIVVPEKALFGDAPAGEARDFSAAFTIPTVAAGRYQIRAFLDADGDFNPLFDLTSQPTAGDVGGGFVELATQRFVTFEVKTNQVVEGSVVVVLAQPLVTERPAFAYTSSTGVIREAVSLSTPLLAPAKLYLRAEAIQRAQVRMDAARTRFLIRYADDDGDGRVDDANGDHLSDVYPKVLLRRLADGPSSTSTVVPLIIDPSRYRDALAVSGSSLTPALELIVPPVAVSIQGTQRTVLPTIPAGTYETVVIAQSGQTWVVPNALDVLQTGAVDPTQSVAVRFEPGPAAPPGVVTGRLRVNAGAEADAYVFAFRAEDPPPPAGTGRPVAAASVARTSFVRGGTSAEAPFALGGLPDGRYLVRALVDLDGNFSLLVPLFQQATAGDLVGGAPGALTIAGGAPVDAGTLALTQALPFERPAFAIDGGVARLSRGPSAQRIELIAHPITALSMDASRTAFPVGLSNPSTDADLDKLRDLLPRVILTRLTDGPDPRLALDDPRRIIIPALVDPVPHLHALAGGAPFVPVSRLGVIVLPAAFSLGAGGVRSPVYPVPAGRYRVNVLSSTGQTWSVPSEVDATFDRIGTPLEDPTQAGYVEIEPTPVPLGGITGTVRVPTAILGAPDSQVLILAFRADAPPPPLGSGRPLASAIIQRAELTPEGENSRATYRLLGLDTGRYQVRAYLDANANATPWLDVRNQPDRGDVLGGYFSGAALGSADVNALSPGPTAGIDVAINPALTLPFDRPVFAPPADLRMSVAAGPLSTSLSGETLVNEVVTATGTFVVQWSDVNRDGVADLGPTGEPVLLPRIVAERLDPLDPTQVASPPVVIPGLVPPAALAGQGFPAQDPTNLSFVLPVRALPVVFLNVAIDPSSPGSAPFVPPAGTYRISVLSGSGQTWTVPNDLARTLDPRVAIQGRVLTVGP